MLDIFVFGAALMIVSSKFLDAYTTSKRIKSVAHERNPVARNLMKLIGTHTAVWLLFMVIFLVVIFVLFKIYTATQHIPSGYKVAFIVIGIFISVLQFAVAHTNYYRRKNFITSFLLKIYR